MNRAFNKLESKLSMLGEVKVTYTDILKVQQTTPANQCLAQFQEQRKEVMQKLITIDLFNEPSDNYESGLNTAQGDTHSATGL